MRPTTEELESFVHVAESGSFTRAAERLRVSKSVVSRRVQALEERLGTLLFNRTTHSVTLTDIGAGFHQSARRALDDVDQAVDAVNSGATMPRGLVRITAPTYLGTLHILPALKELMNIHVALEIEVDLNDHYADVVGGGFDLAIRIGNMRDSTLVTRKLGTIRRCVVCSPDYIRRRGRPSSPAELTHHDCLTYTNMTPSEQWGFLIDGEWLAVRAPGRVRTNNGDALLLAALEGMGLVGLPSFITASAVAEGKLIVVLENYPLPEAGLFALFPPSRRLTGRVRVVVEHLARYFKDAMP